MKLSTMIKIILQIIILSIFHLSKWHFTNSNKVKTGKKSNKKKTVSCYGSGSRIIRRRDNMESDSHLFADCVDTSLNPVLGRVIFLIASEDVMS